MLKIRPWFIPALVSSVILPAASLPKDVWAAKNDQGTGAVIIKAAMDVNNDYIQFSYLYRIVSERGKQVVSKLQLSSVAYNIEGRTILPDGKEIPLKSGKDAITKSLGLEEKTEIQKLAPPGMTGNCLVEISWRQPTNFAWLRYLQGYDLSFCWMARLPIGNPCPVESFEIELQSTLHAVCSLSSFDQKPQVKNSGNSRRFVFANLPAYEEVPFALDPMRPIPSLDIYMNPKGLDRTSFNDFDKFWDYAAKNWVIPHLVDHVSKGKHYEALSASLRSNLSGSATEKAAELMMRLGERVRNTDWLTDAEKQEKTGEKGREEWNERNINEVAKRRESRGLGIFLIYTQVLKDAGIPFKLAMGANHYRKQFKPQARNVCLLDDAMVVVEGPDGQRSFFDPSERFLPAGTILPRLQGSLGILVDPASGAREFFNFPIQAAELNRRVFDYKLTVDEETAQIRMEQVTGGIPDLLSRRRFIGKDAAEQMKLLKDSLEHQDRNVTIQKVTLADAQSARKDLRLQVEASSEAEPGRRKEVKPFPLMDWPIQSPASWPEQRRDPIFANYAWTQLATSEIRLPKGVRPVPMENFSRENEFGRVVWGIQKRDDATLRVVLRVDFREPLARPQYYAKFREFMGWIQEAAGRTLFIEKGGL